MTENVADSSAAVDYIIVGGGSAGCVLANRLSADPACQVALVEAGGDGRGLLIDLPVGAVTMLPTRYNNWAFETVPQPGLNGRRGYQPRGKTLGGSSAINAMIYIRGHRWDYDHWAALGNAGWSYDEVLPWFLLAEHNERLHDAFHGQGGPLHVGDLRSGNPWQQRFLLAAREAGFAVNEDFNGAQQEGLGLYQVTQYQGERWSAARAYLHPVMEQRGNLHVFTRAQTLRVLFEGKRAVGIEMARGGQVEQLRARREVILCAGALQSPQLLQVSGVGDGAQLQRTGIHLRHHLPGVGRNLQDHVDFSFGYRVPDTELFGLSPAGGVKALREFARWRREHRGLLSSNFAEAGGFLRVQPDSPAPDVQLHFVVALVDDHARKLHLRHGLTCHVCLLRPRSRGTVLVSSGDVRDAPLIDPKYFDDPDDLEVLVEGWKLTQRLMQAPAIASRVARDMFTQGVSSDHEIREAIRNRGDTIYHPSGTCKMGSDPMAVVDASLRVHGLQSLRVVDASIMPTLIGGNTNAPTIMIAEKAAAMILAAA